MEKEMTPFFTQVPSTSADSSAAPSLSTSGKSFQLWEYRIDASISGSTLKELVYFAYHRRCSSQMTVDDALNLATVGVNFKIHSLIANLLEYLVGHCTVENVLTVHKIAATYTAVTGKHELVEKQMATLQTFIEDHFQQVRHILVVFKNILQT